MNPARKIAAHRALLPDRVLERPLVEVDSTGRVVSVGQYEDFATLDMSAGVEFCAGMLVPALVNAHTHLELSHLRGVIPCGCGYAGFAAGIARTRNAFTEEQRLEAMAAADREMFDAGIGLAGDIANDESSSGVKSESRITYRTFCEVFGLKTDNFERALEMSRKDASGRFSVTPHSLYSLNDSLLRRVCSEGEGVLSIHFMESAAERELFEGRGPLREWFDAEGFICDFLHYGSPAERLVKCIPADRSVMLVHCTCVSQQDIDLIMNHFRAPVHWCLCPSSNLHITGLQPDVGLLRRNGLNICLGTDSLASNSTLSLSGELRQLSEYPATEVLRWATSGGAEALGCGDTAGRIEKGLRCGLAAVSGVDFATDRFTEALSIKRIV